MKSEVHEVIHRVEIAERVALRLQRALEDAHELADDAEERRWLDVAARRLTESAASVRATLERSIALPEFKAVREERQHGLEQEWLGALRELHSELLQHVGETSPLVEALFPHRRFEKLERGGTVQRAYRAQFTTRRASTYVRRMAADPDYPFLAPLLERIDRATDALGAGAAADELAEEDALELRADVVQSGEALARALRQARALAEAALVDQPERIAALGFEERPRRRATAQPAAERAAD